MIRVEKDVIRVETSTLTAVIRNGWLVSLKGKADGAELITDPPGDKDAALELVYRDDDARPLDQAVAGRIVCRQLSDHMAEVRIHSWRGDGVLVISEDMATGDLIVEPSAYSNQGGVMSCRWKIQGFPKDFKLVVPIYQGLNMSPDDPLIRGGRFAWPVRWEAALAILQGEGGGFWVHTRDEDFRFKTLKIGNEDTAQCLNFDSEAFGPLDENLSAGGIAWRINVFRGDWKTPAGAYRDWMYKTWDLRQREDHRRPWVHDVRLALCWCPCDMDLLDAVKGVIDPKKVLLHVSRWRTDNYDQNYPTFVASEQGKAFVAKASEMGFRAMPHCNAIDMDPTNEAFTLVRDFQQRRAGRKTPLGWGWAGGKSIGVAASNLALASNRDKNLMVKIHPGLAMWRSILAENVQKAAEDLKLETVFLDVTLCIENIHQCLVDGQTPSEGMIRLIDHIAGLGNGLVVGGEGLNEVTAPCLSFAQAHNMFSCKTAEEMQRTIGCPINEFLFGKLCRTVGYIDLSGNTELSRMRMKVHAAHGAIPTLTVRNAQEILQPNDAVKEVLKQAAEGK